MSRILALLACLLLAACAASPEKRYGPGSGYHYSPEIDACIKAGGSDCETAAPAMLIDGHIMQTGSDEAAEAWITYHLVEPHLDDGERTALKHIRRAHYFDQGTTAVALLCGLKEANPLFLGARVALIPVVHWGLRKHFTAAATKTPRAYSSAPDIEHLWLPNSIAGGWNVGQILIHCVI